MFGAICLGQYVWGNTPEKNQNEFQFGAPLFTHACN